MKPRFQIAFGIGWIVLGLMNGGRTLLDGFTFLFKIDKSFIENEEQAISYGEIWRMHNGFWAIAMIGFGTVFIISAIKAIFFYKSSGPHTAHTNSSEQGSGGQAATRSEST